MYIFERGAFLENDRRITAKALPWRMDPLEAVDIDEEIDFVLAEVLASRASA